MCDHEQGSSSLSAPDKTLRQEFLKFLSSSFSSFFWGGGEMHVMDPFDNPVKLMSPSSTKLKDIRYTSLYLLSLNNIHSVHQ